VVCNHLAIAPGRALDSGGRNPLTGLSGLQLYPPKNAVLDSTAGGGVCEKDEAWNMHRPKGGRFAGFRPMGRLRKRGQGRMHKRISPSPWEETGFQGPLPDARDRDIIALSGNGVPSPKACQERLKEGYYTLRKREEMPLPHNKADGGSNWWMRKHCGVHASLPVKSPGLARRPAPGAEPGPLSRDRGAPAGGRAILPP
jgi:hypothetical protein